MTGDQESIVKDLVDRVHLLMGKYRALKKEFVQLSEDRDKMERQIDEQKIKIENTEQQYKTAKIATNVLAPIEDKEEARSQINRIVREIDDCIALLNK